MVVLLIKIVGRNNRRIVDGCRALKHLFPTGSRAELVDPGAHRFGEGRLVVLSRFDDGVLIGRAHLLDVGQGPAGKEVDVPVMSGPVQPLVPFGDIGIPAPERVTKRSASPTRLRRSRSITNHGSSFSSAFTSGSSAALAMARARSSTNCWISLGDRSCVMRWLQWQGVHFSMKEFHRSRPNSGMHAPLRRAKAGKDPKGRGPLGNFGPFSGVWGKGGA